MRRRTEDILETLRKNGGYSYISDLRLCSQARRDLCRVLEAIPQERFSNAQWREAYTYLTGETYRGSSQRLRQMLIQKLRGNTDDLSS